MYAAGPMTSLEWVVFGVGTMALALVSRRSLFQLRSHGFYRFFAWEILLALFVVNAVNWFRDPLAWHQLISWGLLVISLALLIPGVKLLRTVGQPDAAGRDTSLLGMEKTSRLVTVGLYRYMRHPLYSSLQFLAWGMSFKSPSWLEAALALLCTLFLTATARVEERENIDYFGGEYVKYMKRSKRFIPFVF